MNLKKAPGNKLTKSVSLPGQNGNPTFAAVAAGYDKSPGEFICQFAADESPFNVVVYDASYSFVFTGGSGSGKPDSLGKVALTHMTSVESDGSDRCDILTI